MTVLRSSSVWLAAAAALVATTGPAVRSEGMARTATGAVAEAVAQAVAERLGGDARVEVTRLQSAVSTAAAVTASPAPGARTGAPARFTLFDAGKRIGTASATVRVTATHVRARQALARNQHITAADVEEVDAELVDQPMRRLPALSDAIGARLRRNVAAGEPITAAVIEVPALVKSGDAVRVVVRVGAVEAEGRGVASGSGYIGDIVTVVNSGSRRPLKARITGPGQVEIIQ
ncbi:MAG: flagellar basal body P-ring formation chaperone FlgA [Vicinamibacterales bacterium]